MKIGDAVKIAGKSGEVKAFIGKGYFLNSGMAFIEPLDKDVGTWNLTYYEPTGNSIIQIVIEGDSATVKEMGTPIHPTKLELKLSDVKTSSAKMLEKARKEFKKYNQPISQIILSLQRDDEKKTTWRVNFITKMLYLIAITLDAKTGKLLSSESHSLAK